MKIQTILFFVLSLLIVGCALPSKTVTLMGKDKEHYIGRLDYPNPNDPLSGILIIEYGPNGEQFTGNFIIVTQPPQGMIMVPPGVPRSVVGSIGFWYAQGSKGATMKCELKMGAAGHGQGTCKHSNSSEYEILF